MAIKTILVSQPKPEGVKSPYFDLAEKYKLKIDFRPFIFVEGIQAQEFRTQRVNLNEHTAVILTSKAAIDNFFRIADETRFTVPDTMKYFCISEAVAYYLQKYVSYRKRKIFFGKQTIDDLIDTIKKHKKEKFLFELLKLFQVFKSFSTLSFSEISLSFPQVSFFALNLFLFSNVSIKEITAQ